MARYFSDPRTNRALSRLSISYGVMTLTLSPMHTFGILILCLDGAGASWVTSVFDFLDAENPPFAIFHHKPIPERRAEIETVMQVLCADEYVGIKQIGHQKTTPSRCPSSRNVAIFFKPSIRKASVKEVRPSKVLTYSARAKRLLTRAG